MVDSVPVNEVPTNGGIKVYGKIHRDWWKEVQAGLLSLKPLTTGKSYDYYPRGRVTYVELEDKFNIFQDSCITKKMTKEIVEFFNLLLDRVEEKADKLYKCHKCKENKYHEI